MKTSIALLVAVLVLGIVRSSQALPNLIVDKDQTYVATSYPAPPRVSKLDTAGVLWTRPVGGPTDLSLSLTLEKGILYVVGASSSAPNFGFVWALAASSGDILWQAFNMAGGAIWESATFNKGVLYIAGAAATTQSRVSALDAATGEILWQTSVPLPLFTSPIVEQGAVTTVSGGYPGIPAVVFTMDATTGQLLNTVPAP
jgi:outer membrane protein assembly factor BamB